MCISFKYVDNKIQQRNESFGSSPGNEHTFYVSCLKYTPLLDVATIEGGIRETSLQIDLGKDMNYNHNNMNKRYQFIQKRKDDCIGNWDNIYQYDGGKWKWVTRW